MNTQKEIGKGILWVGIERFASQAIQFAMPLDPMLLRILAQQEARSMKMVIIIVLKAGNNIINGSV